MTQIFVQIFAPQFSPNFSSTFDKILERTQRRKASAQAALYSPSAAAAAAAAAASRAHEAAKKYKRRAPSPPQLRAHLATVAAHGDVQRLLADNSNNDKRPERPPPPDPRARRTPIALVLRAQQQQQAERVAAAAAATAAAAERQAQGMRLSLQTCRRCQKSTVGGSTIAITRARAICSSQSFDVADAFRPRRSRVRLVAASRRFHAGCCRRRRFDARLIACAAVGRSHRACERLGRCCRARRSPVVFVRTSAAEAQEEEFRLIERDSHSSQALGANALFLVQRRPLASLAYVASVALNDRVPLLRSSSAQALGDHATVAAR